MRLIIKGTDEKIANQIFKQFKENTKEGLVTERFKLFTYALGIKADMYFHNGNLIIEKREGGRWSYEYHI